MFPLAAFRAPLASRLASGPASLPAAAVAATTAAPVFIAPAAHRLQQARWATKKSGGSTSNNRSSQPKYLGFKRFHGAQVEPGNIIIRQRGTQWHAAHGVGLGRDHTIYALRPGTVVTHYDLALQRRYISVDDGTMQHFPSKKVMKQRLADAIDIEKYLSMSKEQQYHYVMDMIKVLSDGDHDMRRVAADERLSQTGRRKLDLVDLTLL